MCVVNYDVEIMTNGS